MRTLILYLIPIASFALLASCEKVEQKESTSDKAVVEGYLIADQKIKLTILKEIAYNSLDSTEQPIEGLKITLTNNGQSELMLDNGSGNYISDSFIARSNEKYQIEFDYGGAEVKASTIIPDKPANYSASANSIFISQFNPSSGEPPSFPDPIELKWSNPDSRYFLVVVKNIEKNPTPIFDSTRFKLNKTFRNKPVKTNNAELNMRSFNYYGTHRVILFNLNPEYASLYENNGSSSLNLTTPPSNVENGLGIFTGINSDTITVEVYQ